MKKSLARILATAGLAISFLLTEGCGYMGRRINKIEYAMGDCILTRYLSMIHEACTEAQKNAFAPREYLSPYHQRIFLQNSWNDPKSEELQRWYNSAKKQQEKTEEAEEEQKK